MHVLEAVADENEEHAFGHLAPDEEQALSQALQGLARHHGWTEGTGAGAGAGAGVGEVEGYGDGYGDSHADGYSDGCARLSAPPASRS